jgi:hypothetical protein
MRPRVRADNIASRIERIIECVRCSIAWAAAIGAAVGCGRVNFAFLDNTSGASDAGDGQTTDAPGPCTAWSTFGAPMQMPEVNSVGADDWGPYVSADDREMYMFSNRTGSMSGSHDIWVATRNSPTDTFGTPVQVPNVNSATTERSPWLSTNGLTLGFGSQRTGGMGQHDLYWTERADTSQPFATPVAIPNVSSTGDEFCSVLSANGLRLYIVSTRLGNMNLFVAERSTLTSPFSTPIEIPELNTPQTERHLAITADELEVFIDSNRTGSQGVDIYRATRPNLTTPFTTPVLVPELSSPMDEIAPSLSRDGSAIYFAYDTVLSGGADAQVWFAKRTCLAH